MASLPPQIRSARQARHELYLCLSFSLILPAPPPFVTPPNNFFAVPPIPFPPSYLTRAPAPAASSSPFQYPISGNTSTVYGNPMSAPS